MKTYLDLSVPEIYDVMAEANITQVRLARAAGVARGTLNCWLGGVNRVDAETAEHLLQVAQELASRKAVAHG
jgi:transcriptional regulator with XRE-family HTH domain